jgi:hypothetical protein
VCSKKGHASCIFNLVAVLCTRPYLDASLWSEMRSTLFFITFRLLCVQVCLVTVQFGDNGRDLCFFSSHLCRQILTSRACGLRMVKVRLPLEALCGPDCIINKGKGNEKMGNVSLCLVVLRSLSLALILS